MSPESLESQHHQQQHQQQYQHQQHQHAVHGHAQSHHPRHHEHRKDTMTALPPHHVAGAATAPTPPPLPLHMHPRATGTAQTYVPSPGASVHSMQTASDGHDSANQHQHQHQHSSRGDAVAQQQPSPVARNADALLRSGYKPLFGDHKTPTLVFVPTEKGGGYFVKGVPFVPSNPSTAPSSSGSGSGSGSGLAHAQHYAVHQMQHQPPPSTTATATSSSPAMPHQQHQQHQQHERMAGSGEGRKSFVLQPHHAMLAPQPAPVVRDPEHKHIVEQELRRHVFENIQMLKHHHPGRGHDDEDDDEDEDDGDDDDDVDDVERFVEDAVAQQARAYQKVTTQLNAVQRRATLPHTDVRARIKAQEPAQARAEVHDELHAFQNRSALPHRQVKTRLKEHRTAISNKPAAAASRAALRKKGDAGRTNLRSGSFSGSAARRKAMKKFKYHEYLPLDGEAKPGRKRSTSSSPCTFAGSSVASPHHSSNAATPEDGPASFGIKSPRSFDSAHAAQGQPFSPTDTIPCVVCVCVCVCV